MVKVLTREEQFDGQQRAEPASRQVSDVHGFSGETVVRLISQHADLIQFCLTDHVYGIGQIGEAFVCPNTDKDVPEITPTQYVNFDRFRCRLMRGAAHNGSRIFVCFSFGERARHEAAAFVRSDARIR